MSDIDLTGKVAIVTGAGGGLGAAYATALAAAGGSVVVNDVDGAAADRVVSSIREAGGTAVAHTGPVGPTATADELVATADREFGRLDCLVANAGILRDKVLWKMSDDDFDQVVNVHLRGSFTCGRAAAVYLREQGDGGSIVLVGSPAGQYGSFGQTNYAACKAGLVAMARTWSMELGRSGIRANAIVPTAATPMTRTIPAFSEHVAAYEDEGTPLPDWMRRDAAIGTPADVAALIVWLASDASNGVTGQTLGLGGDRFAVWSYPEEAAVRLQEGGFTAADIDAAWRSDDFVAQPSGVPPVAPP